MLALRLNDASIWSPIYLTVALLHFTVGNYSTHNGDCPLYDKMEDIKEMGPTYD